MKSENYSNNDNSEISNNEDDNFTGEGNSESLYALYDIQSASNMDVVSTNLPVNSEHKLKQVLLEKLKKSSDDPAISNSGMFRLNMESGPLSCYYHLVGKPSVLTSVPKDGEFIHVASHNALLAVLASPWEGLFELFSSEVEVFFSSLQTYIDKSSLLDSLRSWYTDCIEYLTRATKMLQMNDLMILLEVALHLGQIEVKDVPQPLSSDLLRFLECCSFNIIDYSPKNKDVIAVYKENTFISGPVLSSLSQSWAKDISASSDIPVKVRQTIEWYKIKGIQDLNTLKRHVKKAGNDYYELHEASKFLSKTGYPFVLLEHVSKENDVTTEDEEIINTLKEHLLCKGI